MPSIRTLLVMSEESLSPSLAATSCFMKAFLLVVVSGDTTGSSCITWGRKGSCLSSDVSDRKDYKPWKRAELERLETSLSP